MPELPRLHRHQDSRRNCRGDDAGCAARCRRRSVARPIRKIGRCADPPSLRQGGPIQGRAGEVGRRPGAHPQISTPAAGDRTRLRRLTGFIEALPMPERQLLEKQLAARNLAQRVAVAAGDNGRPPGRDAARSDPAPHLPLPHTSAGASGRQGTGSGGPRLLQAMLRKTTAQYGKRPDRDDIRRRRQSKRARGGSGRAATPPKTPITVLQRREVRKLQRRCFASPLRARWRRWRKRRP